MNPNTNVLFPTRITRLSYLVRWVFLGVGAVIASCMMDAFSHSSGGAALVLLGCSAGLILFCFAGLFFSILIPRLRDMGVHPAWSLLIFPHCVASLFVLALLFIPTNAFVPRSRLAYPGL